MPKKNIDEMNAVELVRQHIDNLKVLESLNNKNKDDKNKESILKKACKEIFYMQPLFDFFAYGVLSNFNDKRSANRAVEIILRNPALAEDFRRIITLETKAAKVMELGCKQAETGSLTPEELKELKDNSKAIAENAKSLSESQNVDKLNTKKPVKEMVTPNKAGNDIRTVSCMAEAYADNAEKGVAKEGCQIQALAKAISVRIDAYIEKYKKTQYLDKGAKYQQALQMQEEFKGLKDRELDKKTDEEIFAYAEQVEKFVQKYSNTEIAGFAKDHPYFKEAREFYGKKELNDENQFANEEDKIDDINDLDDLEIPDENKGEEKEEDAYNPNDPLGKTKENPAYIYDPRTNTYIYHKPANPKPDWAEHEIVALNGLKKTDAYDRREEIDFNINKLGTGKEKSVVLYGMIDGWRNLMIEDMEKFRELLEQTQENPEANFGSKDQEGPDDYKNLTLAIKDCREKLEDNNASLNSIIASFANLKSREDTYVRKHTPRFIGHRTEKTAERFKIVQSMSELTPIHNTLLKDVAAKLKANVAAVEKDNVNTSNKKTDIMNMPLADLQNRILESSDTLGYDDSFSEGGETADADKMLLHLGEAAMLSFTSKAEKKLLTERFARKTGLDTKEKRDNFKPNYKSTNIENCAKNYLANKYLEKLSYVDMPLEKVIDLNEKLREKPYRQELECLYRDRYFAMIIRKHPKDWMQKWEKIENEGEDYKEIISEKVNDYSGEYGIKSLTNQICEVLHPGLTVDDMLFDDSDKEAVEKKEQKAKTEREILEDSHAILAEHLLNIAMKKPENADVLRLVAETSNEEAKKGLYKDIARYMLHNTARLPIEEAKLEDAVKARVKDSTLIQGIANRARNYYELIYFNAREAQTGAKKDNVKNSNAKKTDAKGGTAKDPNSKNKNETTGVQDDKLNSSKRGPGMGFHT